MRKLYNTIINIWNIEELRNRILITLALISIYRIGSHVVLPGLNVNAMGGNLAEQTGDGGLLELINMFSGGAFANASVFALGIMPYITASIVIQLMTIAVPYFQRLQKEGESGRRKINQMTRYLTVIILLVQGSTYVANLYSQINPEAFMVNRAIFIPMSVFALTAGSMFVMWLGEKITDRGIGNGISIIIMIGIIASLPSAFMLEFSNKMVGSGGGPILFIVELVILFLIFMASILLVQGVRRVPVNYAKKLVGTAQVGGARQYIPLKVNAAGVMPIIFAQAIIMLPMALLRYVTAETADSWWANILLSFTDMTGWVYNLTSFLLIVAFTYFYTAMTVNPNQIAEDLKKSGGFVPGIKPGKATAEFLDAIMSRITLPGSIFLGLIAIIPAFAMILGVNQNFALFFGGTSLLIMVGVVLDTLQQIESYLLMRHYDGLLKSGKVKGRNS